MPKNMSFAASQILEGLNEALQDAQDVPVEGLKKTVIYKPTEQTTKHHPLTDALTGIVPKGLEFDVDWEKLLRERLCSNKETR